MDDFITNEKLIEIQNYYFNLKNNNLHFLTILKEFKRLNYINSIYEIFPFLKNKKISQIIWHLDKKYYNEVICKCCDKKVRFKSFELGYVTYCSNSCQSKYMWDNLIDNDKKNIIINKRKDTCLKKYGETSYSKTDECKKLTIKKNIKKYGVEHPFKIKEIKDKIKITCLEKYGVDNISKLEEIKNIKRQIAFNKTDEEKYLTRERYKNTCLEKYGVEHLSQDSDFLEELLKKSFSYKSYRLPSGKIISLQGYEPYIMSYLLKTYNEKDILYKNIDIENKIGKIYYDNEGKSSRYFPDLYLISENRIIEVKSTFTYELDLIKNISKRNECIKRKINFNFYIYDNINKVIKII